MTAREDAIEAAFEAMLRVDGRVSDRALAAVVEAMEPIIRADERAKAHVHNTGTSSPDACECCYDVHSLERDHLAARRRVKELVDERKHLRAQVKALRMQIVIDGFTSEYEARLAMADRFLALLGGEPE